MTRRERVNSPDELRPGDRVEVVWAMCPTGVVLDLLCRDESWEAIVVLNTSGALSRSGKAIRVGNILGIANTAFPDGEVFIRRRSREDDRVARCQEVSRG